MPLASVARQPTELGSTHADRLPKIRAIAERLLQSDATNHAHITPQAKN